MLNERVKTARPCSPYEVALKDGFFALDPEVQRAHLAPLVATGRFDVERGSHWIAPVLAGLLALPVAGRGQPVQLEVIAQGNELLWTRRIGAVLLRTRQRASGPRIVERAGLGHIVFEVAGENGALLYRQTAVYFAGIPLPRFLAPGVRARVSAAPGGWDVEVRVEWRTHLVCRYGGRMVMA
jgi:hypothetical protein